MLKIIKQHKFAFLFTALLSTFFLNMFPPSAAGYELNTVLQIVAGVNLLQRRYQVVSFIVLLIMFVTTLAASRQCHDTAVLRELSGLFIILSVIVFRQVIFSARINTESICAALSGFLLIGYIGFSCFLR